MPGCLFVYVFVGLVVCVFVCLLICLSVCVFWLRARGGVLVRVCMRLCDCLYIGLWWLLWALVRLCVCCRLCVVCVRVCVFI